MYLILFDTIFNFNIHIKLYITISDYIYKLRFCINILFKII